MIVLWIVLGLVALAAIFAVVSYNKFVSQKNLIKDAWANIDTEIKRRADLIPNLVESVKGYASHERGVFEAVTEARAATTQASGPAEAEAADTMLTAALRQLFAVVENYPELKADENFRQLQAQLTETEDRLSTARRFYNANVRQYNERVKQFPSVIIANMFKFAEEPFFEVDEAVRDAGPPPVSFDQGGTAPASPPPAAPPAPAAPGAPPVPPAPTGEVGGGAEPPPPTQ